MANGKSAPAARVKGRVVRCGIIGYGAAFNMGFNHCNWINATPGMRAKAVCDVDASRLVVAANDFPGIETYNDVATMLRKSEIDLCIVVTPHNTHAPLALQCLGAGKHVVVEKPFCLSVAEADRMIAAAKANKRMLSVFQSRRWDGDYKTLRDIIARGIIGDIFHVETFLGGYHHPGTWWRSDKRISGGCLFDWGAHFVDWVLGLVPAKIESVTGFAHKFVWCDVTNEDQGRAIIRFDNCAVADVQISTLAAVGKDRWRILGTKGGIRDGRVEGHFRVSTTVEGIPAEFEVKFGQSTWGDYYLNVADHLLRGKELAVKPEQSRRVISVLESADKSARLGKPVKPKYA